MAGEGIERNIGDHADIRNRFFDRDGRLIDEVVGLERIRAGLVAQVHLDIREGRNRRNAEIGGFLRRFDQLVDAHAVYAGHRRYGVEDIAARYDEHRPDEIIDGQAAFLNQTASPVGLAIAAHAAMAGDRVDQMRFVLHVRMSFVSHPSQESCITRSKRRANATMFPPGLPRWARVL
ncbi:hypothetical protein D3C71_1699320 [compost metagenome]